MPTIEIGYHCRAQFIPFHRRTQRWACIVAHRRCGKTYAAIHDVLDHALRSLKTDARYALGAPTYAQVKDVMWGYLKHAVARLPGIVINESELWVQLHNGNRIRLYALDTSYERMRGVYLDGIVLDEVADIDPRAWPEVIRPALSDRQGWAVWIGTPKGRDAFYRIWREAEKNPAEWFSQMLRASETGILPASELEAARLTMSPSVYAREFECSFEEAGVDQFISGELVIAAQKRKAERSGPKLIGVDVARFGDDRTVLVMRDGDIIDEVNIYRGIDTMETVGRVTLAINEYRPDAVFVDVVGIGAGVVDRLRQLRYRVIEVNSGSSPMNEGVYANLRCEMWGKMRDWIKDRAQLPDRHDLADDLSAPTFRFDHRNRMLLESKAEMKKRGLPSTDIGDALALTFAHPIAPREMQAVMYRQQPMADYDPFNPQASERRRPAGGMEWSGL